MYIITNCMFFQQIWVFSTPWSSTETEYLNFSWCWCWCSFLASSSYWQTCQAWEVWVRLHCVDLNCSDGQAGRLVQNRREGETIDVLYFYLNLTSNLFRSVSHKMFKTIGVETLPALWDFSRLSPLPAKCGTVRPARSCVMFSLS